MKTYEIPAELIEKEVVDCREGTLLDSVLYWHNIAGLPAMKYSQEMRQKQNFYKTLISQHISFTYQRMNKH